MLDKTVTVGHSGQDLSVSFQLTSYNWLNGLINSYYNCLENQSIDLYDQLTTWYIDVIMAPTIPINIPW